MGVDDTGYDVKFFGATASSYMLWDESEDTLVVSGGIHEKALTPTISGNAVTLDLGSANNFIIDLANATGTLTVTFDGDPASASAFTVKVIQQSSARAITWTGGSNDVDFPAATAPTLTSTNDGVDIFVFLTVDGGTIFYGFTAGQAMG